MQNINSKSEQPSGFSLMRGLTSLNSNKQNRFDKMRIVQPFQIKYKFQQNAQIPIEKTKLPESVRFIIYSFLDLMFLINTISKVSSTERYMISQNSANLDQKRCLKIRFCPSVIIPYNQLKFALNVADSFELYIERMQDIELLSFQMIVYKIHKMNQKQYEISKQSKYKEISRLIIGLNFMINAQTFKLVIQPQFQHMFRSLIIKIVQPSSSELIPALLDVFGSFISQLQIDLNHKSIDFYEFNPEVVKNIKALSFKKHGYNFEKLVELFHDIETLSVRTEEFLNVKQSLLKQQKLQEIEIICAYPKILAENLVQKQNIIDEGQIQQNNENQILPENTVILHEIKITDGFKFVFSQPSSNIHLKFRFQNCRIELVNLLHRFHQQECGYIDIYADSELYYDEQKNLKDDDIDDQNNYLLHENQDLNDSSQVDQYIISRVKEIKIKDQQCYLTFKLCYFSKQQSKEHPYLFAFYFYSKSLSLNHKQSGNRAEIYKNPVKNINFKEFKNMKIKGLIKIHSKDFSVKF